MLKGRLGWPRAAVSKTAVSQALSLIRLLAQATDQRSARDPTLGGRDPSYAGPMIERLTTLSGDRESRPSRRAAHLGADRDLPSKVLSPSRAAVQLRLVTHPQCGGRASWSTTQWFPRASLRPHRVGRGRPAVILGEAHRRARTAPRERAVGPAPSEGGSGSPWQRSGRLMPAGPARRPGRG